MIKLNPGDTVAPAKNTPNQNSRGVKGTPIAQKNKTVQGTAAHDDVSQASKAQQQSELRFDEILLESNEIDLEELQREPNFQERRFPSAIYVGIMTEGKRNGKGVMKYANGR